MSSATAAIEAILALLADAGITASRDASTFAAELGREELGGVAILVGLPSRVGGTLGAVTFETPVYVVSRDPVNTPDAVDALYGDADWIARELRTLTYRPTTWGGLSGQEPLSAIEILVTTTVPIQEV